MTRVLAVIALACAGCAEVPPPPAAAFATSNHAGAWQQFCEQAMSVPQATALVAARGADGFELVAMYNGVLCYKRPAPAPVQARPQGAPASPAGPGQYLPVFRDPGF